MGKMKWIYQMVQDGTSEQFTRAYLQAVLEDKDNFIFDSQLIDIMKGKSIMREIKRAEKEYENHLMDRLEDYYEWEAEIARVR